MTELRGVSLLGFATAEPAGRTFRATDPSSGAALEPPYFVATIADVERACTLASRAFESFGESPPATRAGFLRAAADGLEAESAPIVARAHAETGLPLPRLQSELGRTAGQLRLFAAVAGEGSWIDARIDTADPGRKPTPRPDVRSLRRPLGPVVVLGSSNFPLAFSVAGGDTAAALAAGNPVLVKAHAAHPGTSERVGHVLVAAARRSGLPDGVFCLLFDDGLDVAQALVRHPLVQAVGFTGSRAGGLALARLAGERPRPIPVFAEMGSVNPVIVFPGALRARGRAIADGLHASFTLGVGQFCTNPGVVLIETGPVGDAFVDRLAELTRGTAAAPMLTARIAGAYRSGLDRLRALGATLLEQGAPGDVDAAGRAALLRADAAMAVREPHLLDEVFGPSTLLVQYRDASEMTRLVEALDGQLTATVHAAPDELRAHAGLLRLLAQKAGRLVFNQFPTGVEVNQAMVHGGPYPATSDGRTTSVGTRAIERFTRFVAYQGFDGASLPPELQDANPLGLVRLVDGKRTAEPVE